MGTRYVDVVFLTVTWFSRPTVITTWAEFFPGVADPDRGQPDPRKHVPVSFFLVCQHEELLNPTPRRQSAAKSSRPNGVSHRDHASHRTHIRSSDFALERCSKLVPFQADQISESTMLSSVLQRISWPWSSHERVRIAWRCLL